MYPDDSEERINSNYIAYYLEQDRLFRSRHDVQQSSASIGRGGPSGLSLRDESAQNYNVTVPAGGATRSIRSNRDAYFLTPYASNESSLRVESVVSGKQRLDSRQSESLRLKVESRSSFSFLGLESIFQGSEFKLSSPTGISFCASFRHLNREISRVVVHGNDAVSTEDDILCLFLRCKTAEKVCRIPG